MAIYLSSTQISRVYFTSNDIKAICLQNDANKIYPVEVLYSGSGTGSYSNDFAVPAGYSNLFYNISISTGDATTLVLQNNSDELLNEVVMSGGFSNTVTVSAGTIHLDISTLDSSTDWSFDFRIW